MHLLSLISFIITLGSYAYSDNLESFLNQQRRELHEARRELGPMKEKCYSAYPQFFKSDSPDYDKNLHCLEKIQKKDQELRNRHKNELCLQFNVNCPENSDQR